MPMLIIINNNNWISDTLVFWSLLAFPSTLLQSLTSSLPFSLLLSCSAFLYLYSFFIKAKKKGKKSQVYTVSVFLCKAFLPYFYSVFSSRLCSGVSLFKHIQLYSVSDVLVPAIKMATVFVFGYILISSTKYQTTDNLL